MKLQIEFQGYDEGLCDPMVALSAGVFWVCECTFSYQATILDLVTVEDWGKEIFAEGVGTKWKK